MSAKYCTSRISADSSEFSVTPASSSTVVEKPRWRAAASRYTTITAPTAPRKLASGTVAHAAAASAPPKVSTSIAPSAAPAEMPSVKGVASGLRSSAWKTTPAEASALPTSAAASTRGRRAMKKTCASTLVAQGCDQSKARVRLMDVLPNSGARTHDASATTNAPTDTADHAARCGPRIRRPDLDPDSIVTVGSADRHDHQVTGGVVKPHVGVDAVQRRDGLAA